MMNETELKDAIISLLDLIYGSDDPETDVGEAADHLVFKDEYDYEPETMSGLRIYEKLMDLEELVDYFGNKYVGAKNDC